MNSSTLEPQSGDINFRDFTKRRMLHVVLPLFMFLLLPSWIALTLLMQA